jgi:hypothetical protein
MSNYYPFADPTNVDPLSKLQYFEYERSIKTGRNMQAERMGCQIKRLSFFHEKGPTLSPLKQNRMRIVKIENCEYQITKDQILQWLSCLWAGPVTCGGRLL